MTRLEALRIRQWLAGATALAILAMMAAPGVWGGLAGCAALGLGAAFLAMDRRQVNAVWRDIYARNAQEISARLFILAAIALVTLALVSS